MLILAYGKDWMKVKGRYTYRYYGMNPYYVRKVMMTKSWQVLRRFKYEKQAG